MRKIEKKSGVKTYVFEKGDGMRRRHKRYLEEWRTRLPDPVKYSNGRMLRHRPEWYLQEEHILGRPSIGIASLAHFAEWLLYMTQKRMQGSKAHALASRLFRLLQRRMACYMYRKGLDSELDDALTKRYFAVCRDALVLAREAHAAYEARRAEMRRAPRAPRVRPLDTIHKDMV